MEFSTDIVMNRGSDSYLIECLQGESVLETRPLWEEVFSEDSRAFTDYYFSNKASSNTAFICRHLPGGEIVSMVHLTPYEITLQKTGISTFYVVGVATRESHRHRGLMSTTLNKSFEYAASLLCPFVFLMPANPAIYEPFGFSYIYARPQYNVPEIIRRKEVYINQFPAAGIQIQCLEKETSLQMLTALSDFAGKTLSAQYDYYLTRTPSYYGTLLLELYAQKGCIYTFSLHNRLEGYFLYTEEEGRPFIQELLFSEKLHSHMACDVMSTIFPTPLTDAKPIIMAKNLHSGSIDVPVLSNAQSSASKIEPITDYVNYLSSHKGFINEIV